MCFRLVKVVDFLVFMAFLTVNNIASSLLLRVGPVQLQSAYVN